MKSQQTLQNGRYRITQEMGRGGMGIIYQGRDTNLEGRLVAIKENLDDGQDSQKQFQREAVILAKLNHPNLPRVTDYFVESSGRQYLIMDYVEGIDLKDIVRKLGPLPERDVLLWTKQVMEALEYLHEWVDPDTRKRTPVIHRDIKPSNIRRRPGNQIMLVDFGIAKVGTTGTWAGARSITPGYSPVEQYGDETDARSDIYALGATLYYLLTGVAPPEAHKDIPPVRKLNPDITTHTARVIQRAMQKNVNERYQNVEEMRETLFDPTWWERIDLPSSGSVLPRIGDALTGRTTEPRSTRSRSTGSRRTSSRSTASQRPKTASQKSDSRKSRSLSQRPPKDATRPTRRRGYRKSSLLFLLYAVIVIGAAYIFMSMSSTPETPNGEAESAVAIVPATDTETATLLPTDTPTNTPTTAPTATPTESPSSTSTPIPTLTPIATPTSADLTVTATTITTASEVAPASDRSTSTPIHTRTATALPTHTLTATAIDTATATNTLTPVPVATITATSPPSSSTPRPTSTSTLRPSATFTLVPTLTSTPTPRPSATPLPTFTAIWTATWTATSIATHTATSTPRPTPTATLSPTPRPTFTATGIPFQPNVEAFPEGNWSDSVSVELLAPRSNTLRGRLDFRWRLSGISLEENQAYEVIFWDQAGHVAYSLGGPGLTRTNSLTIKLDGAIKELELLKTGNRYRWGIALVQENPHKRLAYLGGSHPFLLENSGNGE